MFEIVVWRNKIPSGKKRKVFTHIFPDLKIQDISGHGLTRYSGEMEVWYDLYDFVWMLWTSEAFRLEGFGCKNIFFCKKTRLWPDFRTLRLSKKSRIFHNASLFLLGKKTDTTFHKLLQGLGSKNFSHLPKPNCRGILRCRWIHQWVEGLFPMFWHHWSLEAAWFLNFFEDVQDGGIDGGMIYISLLGFFGGWSRG